MTTTNGQVPQRLAYSPREAAELIGVSRGQIYVLMKRGDLPSISVGRARRITHEALLGLIENGCTLY